MTTSYSDTWQICSRMLKKQQKLQINTQGWYSSHPALRLWGTLLHINIQGWCPDCRSVRVSILACIICLPTVILCGFCTCILIIMIIILLKQSYTIFCVCSCHYKIAKSGKLKSCQNWKLHPTSKLFAGVYKSQPSLKTSICTFCLIAEISFYF